MNKATNNWFQRLNEERYGYLTEATIEDFGLPPEIIVAIRHYLDNAGNKAQIWVAEQWKQGTPEIGAYYTDKIADLYREIIMVPASKVADKDPTEWKKLKFIEENILNAVKNQTPGANGKINKALVKARKALSRNELLEYEVYGDNLDNQLTKLFDNTFDEHGTPVSGIRQFALQYNWTNFYNRWINVITFLNEDPTNYEYFKGTDLEDEVEVEYYDRTSRSKETLDFDDANQYAEYMLSNTEVEKDIVHTFEDGAFWYNLGTKKCSIEAERMGHCGTSGIDGILFSLRYRPKGQKWSSSMVTVDMDEYGTIGQIKGRDNEAPPEGTWDHIVWFINNMGVKEVLESGEHSPDPDDVQEMLEYIADHTDVEMTGSVENRKEELEQQLADITFGYNDQFENLIELYNSEVDVFDDGESLYYYANAVYTIDIPLGWEGATRTDDKGWAPSNEEERSKFKSIPPDTTDAIEDVIEDVTDDFGDTELTDYAVETHTGEPVLSLRITVDCSECASAVDYENFAHWIKTELDDKHDENVKRIKKLLADNGYMAGSKWKENAARIHTDYLNDLEHFSPWGVQEEDDAEVTYISEWIPAGVEIPGTLVQAAKRTMSEYDLVAVLRYLLGGEYSSRSSLKGRRGIDPGWLVLPAVTQKSIQQQIQSLYSASKQTDKRQLALPGIPQHYLRSVQEPLPLAGNMSVEVKMMPAASTADKPNFDYDRPAFVYYRIRFVFSENDSEKEMFAAAKALRLLDKTPKVFDIVKEAISEVIAEKTKRVVDLHTKSEEQILDGTVAKKLVGSIIDMYSRRDDFPAKMRVAATRWIIDNFDKMNNAEKTVAVKQYLVPISNGAYVEYDIDGGGPPPMWHPRVRTEMERTGETSDAMFESMEDQIARVDDLLREKTYDLRIYSVRILCGVHEDAGGTAEQTENEIRGIAGVTTVAPDADKKRKLTPVSYAIPYNIKFELSGQENRKTYVMEQLIPSMRRIDGLSVVKILGGIKRVDSKASAISESKIMKEYYGNSATGFGGLAGNLGAQRQNFGREMETPRPSLQDIIDDWADGGVQLYDAPSDTTDMRYHVMMPVEELWSLCDRHYRGGKVEFDSRYRDFIRDGVKAPVYLSVGKNGRAKITGNEDIVWFAKHSGLEEVPVFIGYQRQV